MVPLFSRACYAMGPRKSFLRCSESTARVIGEEDLFFFLRGVHENTRNTYVHSI